MPLVAAGLFPHPPVLIPEIGEEKTAQIKTTVDAVKKAVALIMEQKPDTVVMMTPHNISFSDGSAVLIDTELQGDMGAFGHPELSMTFSVENSMIRHIVKKASRFAHIHSLDRDEAAYYKKSLEIDWGSFVPLYYLQQAGFDGKIILISPDYTKREKDYALGGIVTSVAKKSRHRVALIASGDLSHKLTPDAPHGYTPEGEKYDAIAMKSLETRDPLLLDALSTPYVSDIDTCGLPSLYFLLGALGNSPAELAVLSHEGPFGVGYGVALYLPKEEAAEKKTATDPYVKLAKEAIEKYVKTGRFLRIPKDLPPELEKPGAVLITLREYGATRGYAYALRPQFHNLAEEIIHMAKAAATESHQYMPVQVDELDNLDISVETIESLEPISSIEELDPSRYAFVVEGHYQSHPAAIIIPAHRVEYDTPQKQWDDAKKRAPFFQENEVKLYRMTTTVHK